MTSDSCNQARPFTEGPKPASVMLVGQNPGREEVRQGRPFVGRAGKYLDRVLRSKGLNREEFYITCVVKEPTPRNRKPTAEEIKRWMPCLEREIREVRPDVMVLMGRVAWAVSRLRGIETIETYHPAAAMRFPRIRERFERDMEKLKKVMEQGLNSHYPLQEDEI
ncbi:MAG: uracil-DNA glycosylase [Desulfobacteraceae bacterium]